MKRNALLDGIFSRNIEKIIISFILLTSSFDIFATMEIGGMTFRVSQLFLFLGLVFMVFKKRINISRQYLPLIIWLIFQLFFSFRNSNLKYPLGYFLWTVLSIGTIVLLDNSISNLRDAEWLYKAYVLSFVVISILGLFQWLLGLIGIQFYITQGSLGGSRIQRINGFSYEPSYYATYLLPGWVLIMYLFENGSKLFTKRQLLLFTIIVSLALFLSTSRMGWVFMAVWVLFRGLLLLFRFVYRRIKKRKLLLLVFLIISISGILFIASHLIKKNGIDFLIAGLGIGGSSAHSSESRISAMTNTFQVFLSSPIFGYGLGGVPVQYCAMLGKTFDSGATMCVWAELLAASGIIGIIPFTMWFSNIFTNLRKRNKISNIFDNEKKALAYALVFECLILALNQSLLRPYVWVLFAMVVVIGKQLRLDFYHI